MGLTRELTPLNGQTIDPVTGAPLGDRSPLNNAYGSGRLDYYLNNGSVLSADGGAAQVQNEVFVTGIGRVQVLKAIKPYARVALAADRYNVFAFWNSRTSLRSADRLLFRRSSGGAVRHLPCGGAAELELPAATGAEWCTAPPIATRKVNTSGTLMRPGQRQPERRLLLRLRPGRVPPPPSAASGRGGAGG